MKRADFILVRLNSFCNERFPSPDRQMKIVISTNNTNMNHSHLGNAWSYWVVSVISVLCSCGVLAGRQCSAIENNYWNSKSQTCVICLECTNGHARNFSEQYTGSTGPKGDEWCLPCRRSPPGYYIQVLKKHPAFFQRCVKNCSHLFRVQQTACGDFSDAVCGSCYAGYHDDTNNIDLACPKTTSTQPTSATTLKEEGQLRNDSFAKHDDPPEDLAIEEKSSSSVYIMIVGIPCGVLLVLVITVIATWLFGKKRRQKQMMSKVEAEEDSELLGRQKTVSITMNVDPRDLYTDGPPETTTDERCRRELCSSSMLLAVVTDSHNALPHDINRLYPLSKERKICECHNRRPCRCVSISTQYGNIQLMHKTEVINIVAKFICHDPVPFFRSFEILNAEYFQTFSDMERNPDMEGSKEGYRQVLAKWVQKKGEHAFLSELIDALCKHNFHDICDVIASEIKVAGCTSTGVV